MTDPLQIVGGVNAVFILASVWLLAGGKHQTLGLWLMMGATTAGMYLGVLTGTWGLFVVNIILLVRTIYLLCPLPPRSD